MYAEIIAKNCIKWHDSCDRPTDRPTDRPILQTYSSVIFACDKTEYSKKSGLLLLGT